MFSFVSYFDRTTARVPCNPGPSSRRQPGTGGCGGRGEKKHRWDPQPSPLPHTSSLGYFWEAVLHGSFFFKEWF